MNLNKNISIWRGDSTPPTNYHFWIKSDGNVFINSGTQFKDYKELSGIKDEITSNKNLSIKDATVTRSRDRIYINLNRYKGFPVSFQLDFATHDQAGIMSVPDKEVVDKANVLASSRLWRQVAKELEPQYPDVVTDYMFVDNAAMRMLAEPTFFDVMVTENTFGDILTDEGSCITGSMGLLPSASTGESTPVFEPVHGSWPQAAGKNLANPLAQILSVAMMLEYFDLKEEAALIRKAVDASLDANVRTPEIQVEGGESYGTKEVGAWIVDFINKA